jgi:hypothetical protein
MSVFRTATTPQQRIDPFKRVKYSLGLVLGVDEFEQEQSFFLERGRLHNRALHGYGTVYGLRVKGAGETEPDKITVEPGLAVDPLGREIRVAQAQCAQLNEWLAVAANRPAGERPENLDLYVLLCYRECETDRVPVPGAPCRTEEENLASSRISESFDLKFSLTPPNEMEEEAVRRFGELLRRIEVTAEHPEDLIDAAGMEQQVRGLVRLDLGFGPRPIRPGPIAELPGRIGGLPGSIGGLPGSIGGLPGSIGGLPGAIGGLPGGLVPIETEALPLRVHPDKVQEVLEAAFRTWVTEVLPKVMAQQTTTSTGQPVEQAVLLARLACQIDEAWQTSAVTVHDEVRPYLLETRVLQEYLLNREQANDHGRMEGLDDDDHTQYLLVNPGTRTLKRDLDANGFRVVELAKAEEPGQAVPFEQAVKEGDPAAGDVTGRYPSKLIVQGIYGRAIVDKEPEVDAALLFNGEEWEPKKFASGVTDHALLLGLDKDDHKQYLRADGFRPLTGNLNANNKRITGLPGSVANGDPVVRGEGAGGDLAGTYPLPTVARLQGKPVANADPAAGTVLTWDGAQWVGRPLDVLHPVATGLPLTPFVTIARIPYLAGNDGPAFRLWFHLDAGLPKMESQLPILAEGFEVSVFSEELDPQTATPRLRPLPVKLVSPEPGMWNVYNVDLDKEAGEPAALRFAFYLPSMKLKEFGDLMEFLAKRNIKYLGHDGREYVTAYWNDRTGADLTRPVAVANGKVTAEGGVSLGNFSCELVSEYYSTDNNYYYLITFPGYSTEKNYIVTGTPVVRPGSFEFEAPPIFCAVQTKAGEGRPGIRVELRRQQDGWPIRHEFQVAVCEVPSIRIPDNW